MGGFFVQGAQLEVETNLVEVHKVMLHTKHQDSRPYGFRQKAFSCFPCISFVKHVTPGHAHFGPRHNLNNIDRGPLDDATYPISRL